jgi:hypothetical protein
MYGWMTAQRWVNTLAGGLRNLKRGWLTMCLGLAALAPT